MSDAPGLPKVILLYWVVIGGLLVGIGISHGLAIIPIVAIGYLISPGLTLPIVFAGIGWIAFYTFDTVNLIRYNTLEQLREWFESLGKETRRSALVLAYFYMSSLVLIGGGICYALSSYLQLEALALASALVYPTLDVRVGMRGYPTPGSLPIIILLKLIHGLGYLKDISANGIIAGISQTAPN